jgi:hypothetical protein
MFQNDAAAGEAGILPRGAQEEQASSPPKAARNVIQPETHVSEVDASLFCGAGEGPFSRRRLDKREGQFD